MHEAAAGVAALVALVAASVAVATPAGPGDVDARSARRSRRRPRPTSRPARSRATARRSRSRPAARRARRRARPPTSTARSSCTLKSVYNVTRKLGWIDGRLKIRGADDRTSAYFTAVNVDGKLDGWLRGSAGHRRRRPLRQPRRLVLEDRRPHGRHDRQRHGRERGRDREAHELQVEKPVRPSVHLVVRGRSTRSARPRSRSSRATARPTRPARSSDADDVRRVETGDRVEMTCVQVAGAWTLAQRAQALGARGEQTSTKGACGRPSSLTMRTGSGLRIAAGREASTASAIATIARADSDSGSASTTGAPASPASRSAVSSGTVPSSGTPSSSASCAPPPEPNDLAAHVLDHAEQLLARLLRHHRGARGDLLGERLRRRHDEHLGARQQLAERDRHVAGAGRHVDDERVELAPVDVGEELLERAVEHRPAPHHRRVLVEEVADRDQLQAAADRRHDHLVDDDRALVDAEHVRDRVAVDVGVDHADLLAQLVERGGEVDGQRRLADAALAARDRDHARARIERDRLLRPAAAQLRRQRRPSRPASSRRSAARPAATPGSGADVLGDLVLERAPQRAAGDGERDRDRDGAAVDRRRRGPCRAR